MLCHNPDATDIARRPADPATTPDGKKEESIDLKRMIHGIHAGRIARTGSSSMASAASSDYSDVDFIGNNRNCLTCHRPGTYSTEAAAATLASTVDTGDGSRPDRRPEHLPVAAACSSCHDDVGPKHHMVLNGASFMALDENIVVPEPGEGPLALRRWFRSGATPLASACLRPGEMRLSARSGRLSR